MTSQKMGLFFYSDSRCYTCTIEERSSNTTTRALTMMLKLRLIQWKRSLKKIRVIPTLNMKTNWEYNIVMITDLILITSILLILWLKPNTTYFLKKYRRYFKSLFLANTSNGVFYVVGVYCVLYSIILVFTMFLQVCF